MKRSWISRLVLSTCVALPCALSGARVSAQDPAPAQETQQARIDRLVRALNSDDYDARAKAQRELVQIGRAAVPALKEAAKSEDPNLASWAEDTLYQIEQRPRGEEPRQDEPQDELRRGGPQQTPPMPDPDDILKELQKQLPKEFGKLFEQMFGGDKKPADPNQDEERQGEWRPRTRVWTWNNGELREQTPGDDAEARLGLRLGPASAALRAQLGIEGTHGVVVNRVEAGGQAARSGVQLYDVIVALDGRPVRSARDLEPLLAKGGKLDLYRRAQVQSIQVAPAPATPPPAEQPKAPPTGKPKERSF